MKAKWTLGIFAAVAMIAAVTTPADDPAVIPLNQEPHHHLQLHNDTVNVYKVSVEPGDTVLLHKHSYDAVSVMVLPASVTVHSPGKPDAKQELTAAQVRLQPNGYIHSTEIAKTSQPYRNVTLELLVPQTNYRNLCTAVVAGQPLNCTSPSGPEVPQFETNQTRVILRTIAPGQSVKLGDPVDNTLFVMLGDATASAAAGSNAVKQLHAEDFMWLAKGGSGTTLHNNGTSEVKFVLFDFRKQMIM